MRPIQVNSELSSTFALLLEEGHVKTFVGSVFLLDEAGKAQKLSQGGRGCIVLHVA